MATDLDNGTDKELGHGLAWLSVTGSQEIAVFDRLP
jgi:hypothetical protein